MSPDIRKFASYSEVRIHFLHPDVRINLSKMSKKISFYDENIFILSRCEMNMTFSRTSDFTDENTTIGDNYPRFIFF